MTQYKAMFLDFYGTLVHEDHSVLKPVCRRVAQNAREECDWERLFHNWPYAELCNKYNGDDYKLQREIEVEAARIVVEKYRCSLDPKEIGAALTGYARAPISYDDSEWFVKNAPLPVCILSNIDNAELSAAFAHVGWEFDNVVTSEDVRTYKPRPEMFERALDVMGVAPGDVLHVGDSPASDVFGARLVGIDCVWMNRLGRAFPPDIAPPAFEVKDTKELFELLTP